MRIVGGRLKGRALITPRTNATRPTSDRARESIFNILAHADWGPELEGARVIDLFAGSGALGFEALSRGAAFALFVETEAGARGALRENAEKLDLLGVTRMHRRDATALGKKPAGVGAPFSLAFLDPPYRKGLIGPALAMLDKGEWLSPGAIAVVESAANEPSPAPEATDASFEVLDEREYGEARISFLRYGA